ncbi:MAG TPA: hypothetical protein P5081_06015 [Phycisphaerae bacterium]|nr:hypothetical protein [Phycisphaerae bacterium]HRW52423.1 hypothetical protein [Phycisphaerae bacterium]
MALSDFLSAVRTLILDAEDGPSEATARRAWIAASFPGLSDAESEDLARVPAERFGVYTETIFAGERSMLNWAYPISMAIIGRLLFERDNSQPIGHHQYDLVRELHGFLPWRSHSIRDLADGFHRFVCEWRTDLLEPWPGLADLMVMEAADVSVFYAEDEPVSALQPESWAALDVESLLMRPVVVPTCVFLARVGFDAIAFRRDWVDNASGPMRWPVESQSFVACGRAPETLLTEWVSLDGPSYEALASLPRGEAMTINDGAAAWLAAQTEDAFADEASAFAAFCEQLATWARAGIIMAPAEA